MSSTSIQENSTSFASGLCLKHEDAIATLSFGGSDFFDPSPLQLMQDALAALDLVEKTADIRTLVLKLDNQSFDFGSNVMEVAGLDPHEAVQFSRLCSAVYLRLEQLEISTIAAVKGDCFGIGHELILHCDIRVVTSDARFGLTGINFGLVPNAAAVSRLAHLIGESHARMMCLTGAMVSADRAFVMGLVTNVLEMTDFESGVAVLAGHLSGMSDTAIAEAKKLLLMMATERFETLSESGAQALAKCIDEEEVARRLGAFEMGADGATIH